MFGLENQKKKKPAEEFVFELEKELKIPRKHNEIKAKVEARIQSLKEVLRDGEGKEGFETYGAILHGYTSLLKVFSRSVAK
jgi:hypothetical protein